MQTTKKILAAEYFKRFAAQSDQTIYIIIRKVTRTGASKDISVFLPIINKDGQASLTNVTPFVSDIMDLVLSKNNTITIKRRLPTDHLEQRFTSDLCAIVYGDANHHKLNFMVL